MQVAKITIDNILGIEHLEITPGTVTVVEGANGVGKTSVIEAVKAALAGGHDATLLRQGATEGRVVLVLDDQTEIVRTVDAETSAVNVKHPTFGRISSPQTFLKRLADALSVNPVAFLTAPPKKRTEWLLEVLPFEISDDDLRAAGVDTALPAGQGLERIDAAYKQVYDTRTGVNRLAREKKATAEQLRKDLPAGPDPTDWAAAAEAAEAERDQLQTSQTAELEEMLAKAQKVIDETAAEYAAKIKALEEERNAKLAKLAGMREKRKDEIKAKTAARLQELSGISAVARERARQTDREENTRRVVRTHEQDAARHEAESEKLTACLAALDRLRQKALEHTPLSGVTVRDGQIYLHDIPFDRLNRAKQVQLALNVARLRSGDLGLVLVDGLECLDPDTFATFEKVASESGLQLLVNRVTAGPLAVRVAA